MQGHDLISVIMPAYNSERSLATAIESVMKQTYENWELLIVDDCSRDKTLEVAREYEKKDSRIHVAKNDINSGVSLTRHHAVELSKGKWLAFLDSDDMWTAEKLERQMEAAKREGAKLIFTGSTFMDEDGDLIDWVLHVPAHIGFRKLLKQNRISNSSVVVDKACWQAHESMGDGMHEDFACWLKILHDKVPVYGIDEPMLIYRLSKNSKSGNKMKAFRMNLNTYAYVGLNVFERMYYISWYAVNGLLKYGHIRDEAKKVKKDESMLCKSPVQE